MTAKKMTVLANGSMIGLCLVETPTGIGIIEEEVGAAATAEVAVAAGVRRDHAIETEAAAEQRVEAEVGLLYSGA